MKIITTILLGILLLTNSQFIEAQNFYLHPNGVTCMCPSAAVGESGIVNGITYTKRERSQITTQNASTTCTSGITDMSWLFASTTFNGNISSWDVSNVTNMTWMFRSSTFNQSIGIWDVGNVTSMSGMFNDSQFNKPISDWDVGNVSNMSFMFKASSFNQPITNWNVSLVTDMSEMFEGTNFNQPIAEWDVSNVTNMSRMFWDAEFNQPIGNWDVGNVTNMSAMFTGTPFNQPIIEWDVKNVIDMSWMFSNSVFDQPIGNWDVGNVTNMNNMFYNSTFNQPIGNWDVSNVNDMGSMFYHSAFNQVITDWDVGNVTNMSAMFTGTPFNQPIGNWDVGNVTNMGWMFRSSPFNQPIGNWDVGNVTSMSGMFSVSQFNQNISTWSFNPEIIFSINNNPFISGNSFSIENYDLLLQSFSDQNLQNKIFPANNLVYCNSTARSDLINNKGWSISGDVKNLSSIIAPNNLIIMADQGSCVVANVDLGLPTSQSCYNYSITNNAPVIYPLGLTEVIWTITDENGTILSDVQYVTVTMDVDEALVCYVSSDDIEVTKNRIFIDDSTWSNVKHYEVLRESSSGIFQPIGIINQGETSLLDLTSNNTSQSYRYSIRTVDICENVSPNSGIHRTILLQSNISVNNSVNLFWVSYDGVSFDSYKIYRKVNNGVFELIATVPSGNTAYTDNQANVLQNNYEYYVAIDVQPCSTGNKFSTVEIKSNKAVIGAGGIHDDFQENQVVIHPNPILNILNITIPKNVTLSSCTIYNTLGQKVMTSTKNSFSVEHLPKSTYYIKILTSKGEFTKTFIKY